MTQYKTPKTTIFLLAASLFFLFFVSTAQALDIKQMNIERSAKKGDVLEFKVSFDDLSVENPDNLTFSLGSKTFSIPFSALKSKKKGTKFTYRVKKNRRGITRLILNFKRNTLKLRMNKVYLGMVPNSVPFRLSIDEKQECAMAGFRAKGRKKNDISIDFKQLKFSKSSRKQSSCVAQDPLVSPPSLIVSGEAGRSSIRSIEDTVIQVSIQFADTPDAGTPKVFKRSKRGKPMKAPFCNLIDDGSAESGDAVSGDGIYSCKFNAPSGQKNNLDLIVSAQILGQTVVSRGFTVTVVDEMSDSGIDSMFEVLKLAESKWEELAEKFGDNIRAREALIKFLKRQSSISFADYSTDGESATILFKSGVSAGIDLVLESESCSLDDPSCFGMRCSSQPERLSEGNLKVGSVATSDFAKKAALVPTRRASEKREVVKNQTLHIWDAGFFPSLKSGENPFTKEVVRVQNEATTVKDAVRDATCPALTVSADNSSTTTVNSFSSLHNYGIIMFVTHGTYRSGSQDVGIVTSQPRTPFIAKRYKKEIQRGDFWFSSHGLVAGPSYIASLPGKFEDSIIVAGLCHGAATPSLRQAFLSRGASTFVGYTLAVSDAYSADVDFKFLDGLISQGKTTGESYDDVDPKEDIYSMIYRGDSKKKKKVAVMTAVITEDSNEPKKVINKVAKFELYGSRNAALLGVPEVTPGDSSINGDETIDFRVELEGGEDCNLTYRWQNTGAVGELKSQEGDVDSFDTESPTVTFKADTGVEGSAELLVEVFSLNREGGYVSHGMTSVTVQVGGECIACGDTDELSFTRSISRAGESCTLKETCCGDGEDNDNDGLIDCDDVEDCAGKNGCDSCYTKTVPASLVFHTANRPTGNHCVLHVLSKWNAEETKNAISARAFYTWCYSAGCDDRSKSGNPPYNDSLPVYDSILSAGEGSHQLLLTSGAIDHPTDEINCETAKASVMGNISGGPNYVEARICVP